MELKYKLPRHRKSCSFQSGGICDCGARYGGKPFAHWQRMAQKEVAEVLVRALAAAEEGAPYRLPSLLVAAEVRELLSRYPVAEEVARERERCCAGFQAILQEICGGEWNPLFDPRAVGMEGPDER